MCINQGWHVRLSERPSPPFPVPRAEGGCGPGDRKGEVHLDLVQSAREATVCPAAGAGSQRAFRMLPSGLTVILCLE